MNKLSIAICLLVLSACDQSIKPYYVLDNSPIYQYQAGDQLSYNTLDISLNNNEDKLGVYTLIFNDVTQSRLLETLNTLQENFNEEVNFKPPFLSQYFVYNDEGDRVLSAISSGNEIFWLTENGNISPAISYFANTEDTPKEYITSRELQICNETICEKSGVINIEYYYEDEELTKTPYADFDTHRVKVRIDVTISQNSISNTNKLYTLSGKEWIYPRLGVVKYEYDIASNELPLTSLIGHLSQTNISIPEVLNQSE